MTRPGHRGVSVVNHGCRSDRSMGTATYIAVIACCWFTACGGSPAAATRTTPSRLALATPQNAWHAAIKARGSAVTGLAVDGHGHVYLAEIASNLIEEFSVD